jgi:AraC family transcriptional regulator
MERDMQRAPEVLETVARVEATTCTFEVLEGEWPKPIEFPWSSPDPILSMMFLPPSYRIEARVPGLGGAGFMPMGRTFMLPPDIELRARGTGGKVRVARCIFDRDAYGALLRPETGRSAEEFRRALDVGNATVSFLMKRLIEEVTAPGFASEVLIESIATTLVIECGRQIAQQDAPADLTHSQKLSPRHLQQIEDYLEGLEIGHPQIAELARVCGLSPHYFSKLFRNSTGRSLGRHVADWRLRRAERLLLETDLPLKEVAHRLGFASAANFSTSFSKERRIAPGQFRKRGR